LLQFTREFFTHYGSADGALWRTLGNLLFRPGRLTQQYFLGRRRFYIGPMRLYLMASFVFFLAAKFMGSHALQDSLPPEAKKEIASEMAKAKAEQAAEKASAAASSEGSDKSDTESPDEPGDDSFNPVHIDIEDKEKMEACLAHGQGCNWWEKQGYKLAKKASSLKHRGKALAELMLGYAPTAAFFMLPFFAGLLKLSYWGRKRPYGEHFVCSLHLHAFWFLGLLTLSLMPSDSGQGALFLAIPIWTLLALRRIYGGSWWGLLLRSSMISLAYALILSMGVAFLGILAVLAV
jgi:hypothetical protein